MYKNDIFKKNICTNLQVCTKHFVAMTFLKKYVQMIFQ